MENTRQKKTVRGKYNKIWEKDKNLSNEENAEVRECPNGRMGSDNQQLKQRSNSESAESFKKVVTASKLSEQNDSFLVELLPGISLEETTLSFAAIAGGEIETIISVHGSNRTSLRSLAGTAKTLLIPDIGVTDLKSEDKNGFATDFRKQFEPDENDNLAGFNSEGWSVSTGGKRKKKEKQLSTTTSVIVKKNNQNISSQTGRCARRAAGAACVAVGFEI